MKNFNCLFTLLCLIISLNLEAQIGINTDGSDPDDAAMLDVKSTEMGFLPPRLTGAERDAITDPPAGLMIWCSNCGPWGELQVYNGKSWVNMVGGNVSPAFVCGVSTMSDDEGNVYNTVKIGDQCWMKENLNIGTAINSTTIQSNNGLIEKYCYDDSQNNCNTYGGLYQWGEAMAYTNVEEAQGLCPVGWHIPSDDEWKELEMYLGMTQAEADDDLWRGVDEGGKLKETGTTHWQSPNTGASNSSGFTAIPAGHYYPSAFIAIKLQSDLWSSTLCGTGGYFRRTQYDYQQIFRGCFMDGQAISIRCIKG